jgi:hypothetical protein
LAEAVVGEVLRTMNEVWFAIPVFAAFIVLSITAVIEVARHGRFEGKMKRGLPVWREVLPKDITAFLTDLSEDITDGHGRFIRKQNDIVLVQGIHLMKKALFPYVGYIDLSV